MTDSLAATRERLAFRATRFYPHELDRWIEEFGEPSPLRGDLRSNFGDLRSPFRRDRDRLYYSPTFHRLADVTQILHSGPKVGRLHNRLIHSLKVSQLAQAIAERFDDILFADPDVCSAAGLGHDLGHPPFGHVGEDVLNGLLWEREVEGYEGNAQAFRVVTKIGVHHPLEPGFNLTRATLAAMIKYPRVRSADRSTAESERGCYPSEANAFRFATNGLAEVGKPSVEATLVDWSDDISYALHDLDDFYRAGIIQLSRFVGCDLDGLYRSVQDRGPASTRPSLTFDEWTRAFESLCQVLQSKENAPLLRPFEAERLQEGLLGALTSGLITRWLDAIERVGSEIRVDSAAWHEISLLKEYVYQEVVAGREETQQSQRNERAMIERAFVGLEDWMDRNAWGDLPEGLRFALTTVLADTSSEMADSGPLRARAIADFVSQLTESELRYLVLQMS